MTKTLFVIGIVTAAFVLPVRQSRGRPDFSGTWTVTDPEKKTVLVGSAKIAFGPPFGDEFTAKQDDKTLTIDRRPTQAGAPTTSTIFALNGSKKTNKIPSPQPGQPDIQSETTTAWNGGKLVTTTKVSSLGHTVETKWTLALERDGSLTVEMLPPSGSTIPTITFVYKKKA
jgi:hypothetical protein